MSRQIPRASRRAAASIPGARRWPRAPPATRAWRIDAAARTRCPSPCRTRGRSPVISRSRRPGRPVPRSVERRRRTCPERRSASPWPTRSRDGHGKSLRAWAARACGELWWAEPTLREDPDLEAVRRLEGFQAVAVESGRRWREAMSGPPEPPIVIPAATAHRATLVVLQGGSGSVDRVAQQWRGAANLGCTVIVPGRGQPSYSDGDHANWFDEIPTGVVSSGGACAREAMSGSTKTFDASSRQQLLNRATLVVLQGGSGLTWIASAQAMAWAAPPEPRGAPRHVPTGAANHRTRDGESRDTGVQTKELTDEVLGTGHPRGC